MPLTLTIRDARGVWHTPACTALAFTKESMGGAVQGSATLARAIDLPDFPQGCTVRITDPTTGLCLWDGQVSDPGVTGTLTRDLGFEGNSVRLGEMRLRYRALVTSQEVWELDSKYGPYKAGSTRDSQLPWTDTVNAATVKLPGGKIYQGDRAWLRFTAFDDTDHTVSGFACTTVSGTPSASTDWLHSIYLGDPGFGVKPYSKVGAGLPTDSVTMVTGGMWPSGQTDMTLELKCTKLSGVTTDLDSDPNSPPADELWMGLWNVRVWAQMTALPSDTPRVPDITRGLYATEIVQDLVSRARSVVSIGPDTFIGDSSDLVIDSFDYDELTSISDLLADLCALDPSLWWQLGRTDVDDNTAPMNFTRWTDDRARWMLPPGTVEYQSPGEVDLCNVVRAVWTDVRGLDHTVTVLADPYEYPDVEGLRGQVRESDPIELPNIRTATNAQSIAARWLPIAATLPKTATAKITASFVDGYDGDWVSPWEVEPGYMAHIPETGDVLRCTRVEVDGMTGETTLTLGTPRPTVTDFIANLTRKRRRKSK